MIAIFPEIAGCAASKDVERLAILARKYFAAGSATEVKLNVKAMFKEAGVALNYLPLEYKAAVAAKDSKGRFEVVVAIQDDLLEEEERFTLAHCLGHVLLAVQPSVALGERNTPSFKENESPLVRYEKGYQFGASVADELGSEKLADQFAGALLMPKAMLEKAKEVLVVPEKIANFFGVTEKTLLSRLHDIKAIAADPSNFIEAEGALGYVDSTVEEDFVTNDLNGLKAPDKTPTLSARGKKSYSAKKSSTTKKKNPQKRPSKPSSAKKPTGGMSRIREIARQIDNSVDS